eukprot:716054-Amphidinium_carterae.1
MLEWSGLLAQALSSEVEVIQLGGMLYSLLGIKAGSFGQSIRMHQCCASSSTPTSQFGVLPIPAYLIASMGFSKVVHDW